MIAGLLFALVLTGALAATLWPWTALYDRRPTVRLLLTLVLTSSLVVGLQVVLSVFHALAPGPLRLLTLLVAGALAGAWAVRGRLFGPVDAPAPGRPTPLGIALGGITALAWLAVAAVAVVLYVRHARRARSPVVRLEHITPQPYRGLAVCTALLLTGTFAMSTYIPLFVRAGLERSAAVTAWSWLRLTVDGPLGRSSRAGWPTGTPSPGSCSSASSSTCLRSPSQASSPR